MDIKKNLLVAFSLVGWLAAMAFNSGCAATTASIPGDQAEKFANAIAAQPPPGSMTWSLSERPRPTYTSITVPPSSFRMLSIDEATDIAVSLANASQ